MNFMDKKYRVFKMIGMENRIVIVRNRGWNEELIIEGYYEVVLGKWDCFIL